VTRGKGNMGIFRQIRHFSKVWVVWGTWVGVLAVCGDKMIFSPRLIFTIPIIMHNFSYNPIIFIHFLLLKNIFFFNLNKLTLIFITSIIIHNFSYNPITFYHYKTFFSNLKNLTHKHIFKKNLNSIQHPSTFSLPRNPQTDSEYYSYSKYSIPKRTIRVLTWIFVNFWTKVQSLFLAINEVSPIRNETRKAKKKKSI